MERTLIHADLERLESSMRREGYGRVGKLDDLAAAMERVQQQQHQQEEQQEEEQQKEDTTAAAGADLQHGQDGGRQEQGQEQGRMQGQGLQHGKGMARRQLVRQEAVAAGWFNVLMPQGDVYYRPAPVAQVRTTLC